MFEAKGGREVERVYSPSEAEIAAVRKAAEDKKENPDIAEARLRANFEAATARANEVTPEAEEAEGEAQRRQFEASQRGMTEEQKRALQERLEGR